MGWKQITCNCAAYRFPHRLNSGKCQAPHAVQRNDEAPACSECDHGQKVRDPYGVSSIFPGEIHRIEYHCKLETCPWGK